MFRLLALGRGIYLFLDWLNRTPEAEAAKKMAAIGDAGAETGKAVVDMTKFYYNHGWAVALGLFTFFFTMWAPLQVMFWLVDRGYDDLLPGPILDWGSIGFLILLLWVLWREAKWLVKRWDAYARKEYDSRNARR